MERNVDQKKLQECLDYFGQRPVYRKLFQKMKEKYESLGRTGGKIVLTGLSQEDKIQLGGFLQKDYTENRSISVSADVFERCLSKSRFSEVKLEDLLNAYFGNGLTSKKEERQKEQERRESFFEEVQKGYEGTPGGKWLQTTLKERRMGYELLIQQYNGNSAELKEIIKNVFAAAEQLPGLSGEREEAAGKIKRELLAVFAARVTGNPHYFDVGTAAERLLFSVLSFCLEEEKDNGLSETERKTQLYYRAGILKDDLSNDTLAYGIRAWKQGGRIHAGVEGFFREKEPIRLTLRTIGELERVQARQENIYLFENPAVFSVFMKKYPGCAAICVNGQPRLATFLLLDFLKENHVFYYNGDFDPEGLLIAQRLKMRYGESLQLWNYQTEWYLQYLSEVKLSDMRIKKLEKVSIPELQELKACMQKEKRAAYQEAMIEEYVAY